MEILRTMLTGLFEQDDLALHLENSRSLKGYDDDGSAVPHGPGSNARRDDSFIGSLTSEAGGDKVSAAVLPSRKTQVRKRIDDRRKTFEESIFLETSIMGGLRLVYGPQNFQQSGAVLSEIK